MEFSVKNKLLLVIACSAVVLLFAGCGLTVGWYNDAVSLEESVKAQYSNNKNSYDAFWKKVKEVAQIPDKYKSDFKDLLVSETQAKFGSDGSQAQFQWFKDRNINFDPSVYKKVQDVIESGRNDFMRSQTELLDKQRKYRVHLRTLRGRILSSMWDMPTVVAGELAPPMDMDGDNVLTVLDYPIVTSTKTEKAFQERKDDELKVFE